MPVIYVCTLDGYNFKMQTVLTPRLQVSHEGTELPPTLHNCSFKPSRYKQQFIYADMSIHALRNNGPKLLKSPTKCSVCYHWKEFLNENVNSSYRSLSYGQLPTYICNAVP